MREVFLQVLNLSEAASYLIMGVIAARLILCKVPKRFVCLFWLLVAARLAFPFSVESVYSVIPKETNSIKEAIEKETTGVITAGPREQVFEGKAAEKTEINREMVVSIAMWIWLSGMVFMSGYFAYTYLRLTYEISMAIPVYVCGEKVYRSEKIQTPFVLGIFKPRIYIPDDVEEEILSYAIAHEKAHLKRKDNLVRMAGGLFLIVYWFHPLVWISYMLAGRDMEYACDESVIDGQGADYKKGYATALLSCLSGRKRFIWQTAAFGEAGGKKRIVKILNYKRTSFWGVAAVIAAAAVLVICFMGYRAEENVIYYDGAEITFVEGEFCPEIGVVSLVFNVDRNGSDEVNKVVLGGKSTTGKTVYPVIAGDISQEGMNRVTFYGEGYQSIGDEFVLQNRVREEIGVFKTSLIKQEKAVRFETEGQSDKAEILISPHFMEARWENGFPNEMSILVMKTKKGEEIAVSPVVSISGQASLMGEVNERLSQLGYHVVQSRSYAHWDEHGVLKMTFAEIVPVENIQSFEIVSLQL